MKETIVIFIGGYLPGKKYGGPVTSLENFTNQLHDLYDIRIICSDHDFKDPNPYKEIKEGWNQVGFAKVFYTNEKAYSSNKFREIIKEFSDNIIMFYLSGIYYIKMNYAAINLGRQLNIPVLLAPRGDLMKNTIAMKSKIKMMKKLSFLAFCRATNLFKGVYFQSTSIEETTGLKKYLGIQQSRIFEIENLPVMPRLKKNIQKERYHLKILFISRLMVKKNPLFALEVVSNISDEYQITFDLYGPTEDQAYWDKCKSKIDEINQRKANIKVVYRGSLNPQQAKLVYGNYDCFLFPTISENYGHVIVESMFSDCPVILSKGTTPWDDYNLNGGYVCDLKNSYDFTQALEEIADMNSDEYKELLQMNRKYIEHKFNVTKLKQQYLNVIKFIAENKKV